MQFAFCLARLYKVLTNVMANTGYSILPSAQSILPSAQNVPQRQSTRARARLDRSSPPRIASATALNRSPQLAEDSFQSPPKLLAQGTIRAPSMRSPSLSPTVSANPSPAPKLLRTAGRSRSDVNSPHSQQQRQSQQRAGRSRSDVNSPHSQQQRQSQQQPTSVTVTAAAHTSATQPQLFASQQLKSKERNEARDSSLEIVNNSEIKLQRTARRATRAARSSLPPQGKTTPPSTVGTKARDLPAPHPTDIREIEVLQSTPPVFRGQPSLDFRAPDAEHLRRIEQELLKMVQTASSSPHLHQTSQDTGLEEAPSFPASRAAPILADLSVVSEESLVLSSGPASVKTDLSSSTRAIMKRPEDAHQLLPASSRPPSFPSPSFHSSASAQVGPYESPYIPAASVDLGR